MDTEDIEMEDLSINQSSCEPKEDSVVDPDDNVNAVNLNISEGSNTSISKTWRYIIIMGSILFTILVAIAAIIIVCLTTPNKGITCQSTWTSIINGRAIEHSSRPYSITSGHFNNDTFIDIVTVNSGTNTIGIFLNFGNGTFSSQQTFSTGNSSKPISVISADFNNDTYFDIAVTNYDSHTIGIFFGYGNGSFAEQTIISLGVSRPISLAVGDLNNDYHIDIVVTNNGTNTIGILFGNGTGLFEDEIRYFTGYDSFPYSVAIGYFNNDTYFDIAIANYGTNDITIFLGYGNKNFTKSTMYSTYKQSNPYAMALEDLNNDGYLDIAVANFGANNIGIFLSYGNGSFASQITFEIPLESHPHSIGIGNFDQDDYLDIAVSNSDVNSISILIGYGNGSFKEPTIHSTDTDSSPFGIVVADFNNDNQSDVAITNYGTNNVFVLVEYSMINSKNPTVYSTGSDSTPYHILAEDINNDNKLDLIVSNSGTGTVGIFIGYGNGSFHEQIIQTPVPSFHTRGIAIADLDNDQQKDLVVAMTDDETIAIMYGYGNESFAPAVTYSVGSSSSIHWIVINYFNNDTYLDIVYADHGTNRIGIFLGYGNRTYGELRTYNFPDGSRVEGIAVGDFNKDHILDVAIANDGTNTIDIFIGFGNVDYILFVSLPTGDGSIPLSVAVADLNNDNSLDLIVANSGGDNVGVFFGFGNGSFSQQMMYPTGLSSNPVWVDVADFNNDGSLDISVVNQNKDNVGILLGNPNGYFGQQTTYSTSISSDPVAITIADFNKDSQLDIAIANTGSDNIAILLGHPLKYIDNTSVLLGFYYADFLDQQYYSTGSQFRPYSVAIGNLNKDLYVDIIVSNYGNESLGIFFGNSNGSFSSETLYPIGSGSTPSYVILNDFNNDNRSDVTVTNSNNDNIIVLLGDGSGMFPNEIKYSTGSGSNPTALIVDHFNNDKYLDLIVANTNTDSIGIFFGLAYTFFSIEKPCETTEDANPRYVTIADFNKDGYMDMVAALYTSNNVAVFLGYGNGSFTPMTTYGYVPLSHPVTVVVADFNNDNKVDIIIVNGITFSISIILGYGNGSFTEPVVYTTGPSSRPYHATVGDFNNDTYIDIIVANYGTNNIGIFYGYGNGTFRDITLILCGKGSRPRAVIAIDVNNDTHLDIIVVNQAIGGVIIFLGYSNESFSNLLFFSTGGSDTIPKYATAADLNKDGKLDIVSANSGTNNIGILYGNGNGSFGNLILYSTGIVTSPYQVLIGDFNKDNETDIIVCDETSQYVGILFGLSDGTYASISSFGVSDSSLIYGMVVGDLNNDTYLDFALADFATNTIQVCLANSTKPFGGQTNLYLGPNSRPSALAAGYFNNDSHLDIAVANDGTSNIGILLGYGNRMFSNVTTFSTGIDSHPSSLAVGDFNNDLLTDIIVANSQTNDIVVMIGDGTGAFSTLITYSMGDSSQPISISVGDYNRDNQTDVVVANYGTNNVCILFGCGNGTFTNQTYHPLGYNSRPNWITFEDINGDGWKDIAVPLNGLDDIQILLNLC